MSALAALVEDPGSVLSTSMVTHNHLKLQFQGSNISSEFCGLLHAHGAQTYTQAHAHQIKKIK